MGRKVSYDIQIDQAYSSSTQSHPVLISFFFLVVFGILGAGVWFLGFSEFGFAWEGNTAKKLTETPAQVVTSYPFIGISLEQVAFTLEQNERVQLRAHLNVPEESKGIDTKKLDIYWHSENPQVVDVDQRGRVRALQPGTARVSVSIADPDIDSNAAYCFITVRDNMVKK